jgi:hypothetical protein
MLKSFIGWWKQKQQERRDALMFERQVLVSFNDEGVTVWVSHLIAVNNRRYHGGLSERLSSKSCLEIPTKSMQSS